MADGFVQLPPDSTGKKLRTLDLGTDQVEYVILADVAGNAFPESPKLSTLTSANLAAGASVSLDATAVTNATTGKLVAVTVSASVPLKAELRTVVSGTPTTRAVVFTTDAQLTYPWTPPHPNFITLAGNGVNLFRVTLTNQDNVDAADVYAAVYWDEVS